MCLVPLRSDTLWTLSDAQMFKPLELGLEEGRSGLCLWGRACWWEYWEYCSLDDVWGAEGCWQVGMALSVLDFLTGQDDFLL